MALHSITLTDWGLAVGANMQIWFSLFSCDACYGISFCDRQDSLTVSCYQVSLLVVFTYLRGWTSFKIEDGIVLYHAYRICCCVVAWVRRKEIPHRTFLKYL